MERPHVLHVVRTLGFGGMERNLRRVILGTRESHGIEHSILLLSNQTEIVELPEWVKIHRAVTGPRDPRMPYLISQVIARVAPTVIHARNWGAWPDTAIARAARAPKTPLVFSYHGMEASAVSRVQRMKFQAMARLTTRIFAVSRAARALLVGEMGIPQERVGVISNGVDVERFAPLPGTVRSDRFVVGTTGRFFEIKNYPLLLRAFHRALARGLNLELRIAGEGPLEQQIKELAASLGLGDRLVLAGRVDPSGVPAFLRGLDLFVLSSDNEANPNALLEAMSTGLPCLSTAVGGAREVLDGGRCGFLVPPRDEEAMAGAIIHLHGDPSLRSRLGAAARAHAIATYSQARMFQMYAELYLDPRNARLD